MILNLKASENLKVEPPNWWTHFDDRKLELMVYKEKIGNSTQIIQASSLVKNKLTNVSIYRQTKVFNSIIKLFYSTRC